MCDIRSWVVGWLEMAWWRGKLVGTGGQELLDRSVIGRRSFVRLRVSSLGDGTWLGQSMRLVRRAMATAWARSAAARRARISVTWWRTVWGERRWVRAISLLVLP